MPTGPRGEKRPVSPVSSMVKAMKVATGIEEEQYVDGAAGKTVSEDASSKDELEEDEFEMAALEISKPKKHKKRKK